MEKTNVLTLIITLVVGIILAGSLLMPILTNAQEDLDNVHYNGGNEYCIRMSHGAPDADLYFTKPANEMVVECRSGSLDVEPYYIAPLNSVGQMGWIFLSNSFSLGVTGYGPNPIDSTSKYNNQAASGYNSLADTKTVKINATTGKVITWTTDPNNTWNYYDTVDFDTCYWADPNGDYINVQVGRYPVWLENPTDIAGSSQTQGNYIFYDNSENVTVTNTYPATITTETTEKYGLYLLNKVPMTITGSDSSVNNVTSAHVVVKYKIEGEPLAGFAASGLLGAIPIIVIVALVMVAVGAIALRRAD